MAQVLETPYECHTCKKQIRISKIDNVGPDAKRKWNRFELDGVTPHVCSSKKQQQQKQQIQKFVEEENRLAADLEKDRLANLEREIISLKGYVKSLVTQVQLMRQELEQLGGGDKKTR